MIRPVDRNDIPECVRVIRTSFLTIAESFGLKHENTEKFTAFAINEKRLYHQLDKEKRQMFVYVDNDKIIGYYSLHSVGNKECELNNLCVLPEYRHKKIGEALLRHALMHAKNMQHLKMKIGIIEENVKLRNWFEKQGFVHTHLKKLDGFPFPCGHMEHDLQNI